MENKLFISWGNNWEKSYSCLLDSVHHLLVGGATGSGKSIFLHSVFRNLTLEYTSDELKIALIDPKSTEFCIYEGNTRIVGEKPIYGGKQAVQYLAELVEEKTKRYRLIREGNCRDINEYNENIPDKKLPKIIVIIDEYADVVYADKKHSTDYLRQLVTQGHGVGIYMIVATQCPRQDIIHSSIKANMLGRIAFPVADMASSRFILGERGAEKLTRGEFIFKNLTTEETLKDQVSFDVDLRRFMSGHWKDATN